MLKNRFIKISGALLAAFSLAWSGGVHAGIASAGGDAMIIAPPASVVAGALEDNNVTQVFGEGEAIVLSSAITLDQVSPGVYSSSAPSVGAVLSAGQLVRSYFLHFDPVGAASFPIQTSASSLTFSTDIIGVIYTVSGLDGSDAISTTGTIYPTGTDATRDLEGVDLFSISADLRRLDFLFAATSGIDHVRVITKAPEPATYALLGVFLMAAAFSKRRQLAVS